MRTSVLLSLAAMISTSSPADSLAPEALAHPSHTFKPRFTVGSPRLSVRHRTWFGQSTVERQRFALY